MYCAFLLLPTQKNKKSRYGLLTNVETEDVVEPCTTDHETRQTKREKKTYT